MATKLPDVSFDDGEYDAFYGTTPKPYEQVSYNSNTNKYEQTVGDVKGVTDDKSNNTGFDAGGFASTLGYSSTGEAKKALGISSLEDYYNGQYQMQKKQAEEIGNSWDPVFSELDRQLGSLPQSQQLYEGQVASSADAQNAAIEASRNRSTESLDAEKARGLRDLESDIRNQMEGAGRKIGVAGAGSSSAVGQASEAIARAGQRARGGLLETVTAKLADINNLASDQLAKVGTWKQDKLFEIKNFFQNKFDELSSQLATAKKERKTAVEQLIYGAQQDYITALRGLDQQVMSYAQQIDMWQKQRSADLEDYARSMSSSSQVTPSQIDAAVGAFNTLISNGMSPSDANAYLNAQGIYLPTGLSGQQDETPDDLFGQQGGYIDQTGNFVSGGSYIPTTANTDPFAGLFSEN